jgi:hypothetical protein
VPLTETKKLVQMRMGRAITRAQRNADRRRSEPRVWSLHSKTEQLAGGNEAQRFKRPKRARPSQMAQLPCELACCGNDQPGGDAQNLMISE